jgi:cytochrome c oxidase subunit 3/cytochrome o ubiquinol oxidase subunit 3
MSTGTLSSEQHVPPHQPSRLTTLEAGVVTFLCSEIALFSTLITTYVIFLGAETPGADPAKMPNPSNTLDLGLVIINSICLLSSSATIYLALRARKRGAHALYLVWFAITILLGIEFILGTGYEWYGLMTEKQLWLSTNSFGSTFYTLIGFHAFHVSIGILVMMILWGVEAGRCLKAESEAPELVSWYWHFVDGVWILIFTLVYIIGR